MGKGKGFNKDYDCFEFAANAVQALSQHRDFYCFAPLVRVDIMRMQCGRLVINELESLEALYAHCISTLRNAFETASSNKMSNIHHSQLKLYIG